MEINDPILEALSFALENDLNFLPSSSQVGSVAASSSTAPEESTASGVTDKFPSERKCKPIDVVKSSVILGEHVTTVCPFPNCAYSTVENVTWGNKSAQGELLSHLLVEHKLVIDNCDEIANLSKYLNYWRGRLVNSPISDFCVGFTMDDPPKPPSSNSKRPRGKELVSTNSEEQAGKSVPSNQNSLYFMLSPALPEDSILRKELWKERLNLVLEYNREEREDDTFSKRCLFCREVITGNRSLYFSHMRDSHSFHIGQADNLVFVKELVELIEEKLNRLECLFCEHIFKDKLVLKEHMRKKQHRMINPKNKEYDRYYVVNYLEPGKTWETLELEDPEDDRREDEWVEMPEEKENNVVCLFCKTGNTNFKATLLHMKTTHLFDFEILTAHLDFYQKVKLVNYVRRCVYRSICPFCELNVGNLEALLAHISGHSVEGQTDLLPRTEEWNQSQYFFPTYEEDSFLTCLDSNETDDNDGISSEDESKVIPEDYPHIDIKNREFDLAGYAIKYHNQTKIN